MHRTKPLTDLTKGGQKPIPFSWGHAQQEAFQDLKDAFQTAPILAQFDPTLPTVLETDASNEAIAGVLTQAHPDPTDTTKVVWKLVDCYSKTLTDQ